jgi:hypothetical protein
MMALCIQLLCLSLFDSIEGGGLLRRRSSRRRHLRPFFTAAASAGRVSVTRFRPEWHLKGTTFATKLNLPEEDLMQLLGE